MLYVVCVFVCFNIYVCFAVSYGLMMYGCVCVCDCVLCVVYMCLWVAFAN